MLIFTLPYLTSPLTHLHLYPHLPLTFTVTLTSSSSLSSPHLLLRLYSHSHTHMTPTLTSPSPHPLLTLSSFTSPLFTHSAWPSPFFTLPNLTLSHPTSFLPQCHVTSFPSLTSSSLLDYLTSLTSPHLTLTSPSPLLFSLILPHSPLSPPHLHHIPLPHLTLPNPTLPHPTSVLPHPYLIPASHPVSCYRPSPLLEVDIALQAHLYTIVSSMRSRLTPHAGCCGHTLCPPTSPRTYRSIKGWPNLSVCLPYLMSNKGMRNVRGHWLCGSQHPEFTPSHIRECLPRVHSSFLYLIGARIPPAC